MTGAGIFNDISFIRVVSALLIVNHHTGLLDIPYLKYFTKGGFVVNTIFVFISGYLLTYSYEKNKYTFGQFFLKRTFRLYPSLHVYLLFAFILFYVSGLDNDLSCLFLTATGFGYYFDINLYGVQLWFVSVILVCYLLFIPTYKIIVKNRFFVFIPPILLIIFYFLSNPNCNFYREISSNKIYRLIYHYMIFVFGMAYVINRKNFLTGNNTAGYISIYVLLLLSGIPLLGIIADKNRWSLLVLVLSVMLSFGIIKTLSIFYNKFSSRMWLMLRLSDVTYEIYLVHVAIIYVLRKLMAHEWYAYIMTYIFSILAAFAIKYVSARYTNIANFLINKISRLKTS